MIEKSSCGVGFLATLKQSREHTVLQQALQALARCEHRGGVGPDGIIGDGSGVMTAIPYELFGREAESFAVASLLMPQDPIRKEKSLKVFEECFWQFGLKVVDYRKIPMNTAALSPHALEIMPSMVHAIIARPEHCRTVQSFEKLLYSAKQLTRIKEKENGIYKEFYFTSLSARTIVYKALCLGIDLPKIYLDLQNPAYKTHFALFHRRFSTNTISTWDKAQPFRLIAHNGEINTIAGNLSWAITREKALGLMEDELITHTGISDSGNLNVMLEALLNRSSIPKLAEAMALLIPPVQNKGNYYEFWSRGMEPWDGPAMIAFCDGKTIGARLDRNGFRPCRWQRSDSMFYLASEAGVFDVNQAEILASGALSAGESVTIHLMSKEVSFLDPKDFPENRNANFDPAMVPLDYLPIPNDYAAENLLERQQLFDFSKEEIDKLLVPMAKTQQEPLGSMGDTAALAILSKEKRSLFDFFYQDFAQVTNPPLDYMREKIVTDMKVYLGRKPNIFEPKEFIPLKATFKLSGPVISLGQMEHLRSVRENARYPELRSEIIDILLPKDADLTAFSVQLKSIAEQATRALKNGKSLLILSDRKATKDMLPIPSLIALTYLNRELNQTGLRLKTSIILEIGDARNAHHIACLLGHGASSVCPYLAIETVLRSTDDGLQNLFDQEKEKNLISALEKGVMRIMAKMGISVLRSYQGSRLFTPVGLGQELHQHFFNAKDSVLGGMNFSDLLAYIKNKKQIGLEEIPNLFLFKEQAAMKQGELHTLTSKRSRLIHQMLELEDEEKSYKLFQEITNDLEVNPILIRHLFELRKGAKQAAVVPLKEILASFGTGAMSFGAISAESQRDLILAMKEIGGRSNSGEGGENPYYETEKISASIKQVASGRFGVTAEYLMHANEVQIKMAQGAKPGEGGQLMGAKVTLEIAKARFSSPNVDLISPPPQHDIYSIEDLKELIFEIKQLGPHLKVSVKLVSGFNIGAIAVGVVKAGADIIQISGGDGGTGAATLLSMKHAGLPLELGLWEVHKTLSQYKLRNKVILRADGGFISGKNLIIAAILGANEFDFGKIALVAEGCIMARVCEKNTCPTGIATHNPKFKALYKGNKDKVVKLFKHIAREMQDHLRELGANGLQEIIGRTDLLQLKNHETLALHHLDLSFFLKESFPLEKKIDLEKTQVSSLNQTILTSSKDSTQLRFAIQSTDRAIPATICGERAVKEQQEPLQLNFSGSAGQGFGVFLTKNIELVLEGEANDSVGKGMSGGRIAILPFKERTYQNPDAEQIIGNCALYGATGGTLYVLGRAGDRFAVRNSGASAIVGAAGLHACEYMSGGWVWILGTSGINIGAGMTGGVLYLHAENKDKVNMEYLIQSPLLSTDIALLKSSGEDYLKYTASPKMKKFLSSSQELKNYFKFVPVSHK